MLANTVRNDSSALATAEAGARARACGLVTCLAAERAAGSADAWRFIAATHSVVNNSERSGLETRRKHVGRERNTVRPSMLVHRETDNGSNDDNEKHELAIHCHTMLLQHIPRPKQMCG